MRGNLMRSVGMAAVVVGALTVPLAGCGDDTTGPETQNGEMTAEMRDSPDGSGAAMNMAPSHASFSGTMTADAQVQVSADGSAWVDLGSPKSANMQLHTSGNTTTVHSNATVNTGTFAHVRLVLQNASATVDAGSTIGSTILDAAVNLSLGGSSGQVVIEKQINPVTVSAGSHTTVVFDLNSEAWVTEDNVSAQAVSEAELRSATIVTVQ